MSRDYENGRIMPSQRAPPGYQPGYQAGVHAPGQPYAQSHNDNNNRQRAMPHPNPGPPHDGFFYAENRNAPILVIPVSNAICDHSALPSQWHPAPSETRIQELPYAMSREASGQGYAPTPSPCGSHAAMPDSTREMSRAGTAGEEEDEEDPAGSDLYLRHVPWSARSEYEPRRTTGGDFGPLHGLDTGPCDSSTRASIAHSIHNGLYKVRKKFRG